jgi:hypothetical protein
MAWLLAGLAFLALLAAWWWRPLPVPAASPGADPYAADVAVFRRQLHDWDRRG